MHMLSIHFGPNQIVWGLLFKDKERAEAMEQTVLGFLKMQHLVQATAGDKILTVEDDYGQRAHLVAGTIHGALVEDCDYTQEGAIVKHLHGQRTQLKAQQRIGNDPVLKAAVGGQMPSFDPMANRRFS